MIRTVHTLLRAGLILVVLTSVSPALAQDANECDLPGEAPDVIVGDLPSILTFGSSGDYVAYSIGTTSCNIGSCWLNWFSNTNEHPVIAQNMYRIKDGRLDQIGQSWLKHGFFALSEDLCSPGECQSTNGNHLGVNCSDPYSASLNASQPNLGPRSEVNASTGVFQYPFTGAGQSGNSVFRRIKVHHDDLDPALNPGAVYFVEGQYITQDDAAADRDDNNASWRQITVTGGSFFAQVTGTTNRMEGAVQAWTSFQPSVKAATIKVDNDGTFHIGADTWLNGDGTRHYVYAVHNLNSDRGARSFKVPLPPGAAITNIYFNDTDSHSGEPYDTTDWNAYIDYPNSRLVWETATYAENSDANALRWGTVYTFAFDIDVTDTVDSIIEMELYKPQVLPLDPIQVINSSGLPVPAVCDDDGFCERGETCDNCPNDCTTFGSPGFCGDGNCDPSDGEDCTNCSDCNGVQSGPDHLQYCCAQGGGNNPTFCIDPRCYGAGLTCENLAGSPVCCGDGVCAPSEDSCICPADCGAPPLAELTCDDGLDNDCDGNVDCGDIDCCTSGSCPGGSDNDNDGVSSCDCDDGNSTVWGKPSETGTLLLDNDTPQTTLTWAPPAVLGANTVAYETLRSSLVDVMQYTFSCMPDGDPVDTTLLDGQDPAVGEVYYYLVRATNGCPGVDGTGALGSARSAPDCP